METTTDSAEAPVAALIHPKPAYPTIAESWGVLGWFILIMIVTTLPLLTFFDKGALGKSIELAAAGTALGEVATIAVLVYAYRRRLPRLHLRGQVPAWLYVAAPILVVAQVVTRSLINFLHLPNWMEETFRRLEAQPWLAFLMVGISAPVLEEVLFRGVILTGLLRNYRPWVAIGQSALLFGLFHFNPIQIVSAGIMGLLLGWMYYRTRSLLLCIIIHALNNLLALWANTHPTTKHMRGAADLFASPWHYAVAVLLSALLLAWLLWRVHRATEGRVVLEPAS